MEVVSVNELEADVDAAGVCGVEGPLIWPQEPTCW